jgi:hypothetical protein
MRYHFLLPAVFLLLCGCQTIGNWADSIGDHMPVIGDRCEHWQCFTSSGQQISDENKAKQAQTSSGISPSGAQARIPVPQADTPPPTQAAPTATPAQNPAAPGATIPPAPASPTPYDMTPEQLQNLPPPATPQK